MQHLNPSITNTPACNTSNYDPKPFVSSYHKSPRHLSYPRTRSPSLWNQIPQGQIIDDILDLLDIVLDAIAPPSQRIILQVQDLEAGVDILDELADL